MDKKVCCRDTRWRLCFVGTLEDLEDEIMIDKLLWDQDGTWEGPTGLGTMMVQGALMVFSGER